MLASALQEWSAADRIAMSFFKCDHRAILSGFLVSLNGALAFPYGILIHTIDFESESSFLALGFPYRFFVCIK